MLVVDASAAFAAATEVGGFDRFAGEPVAPPLMWPETRSALHVARWRDVISAEAARDALTDLKACPITERNHSRLGEESWRVADELGWAKTYDAEYLALALLLGAAIVTFDRRMRRAAERLGIPTSLP